MSSTMILAPAFTSAVTLLAKACSPPVDVANRSCAPGAMLCTISAMARPSSVLPAGPSASTVTPDAGNAPSVSSWAAPPSTLKLSERIPILTPAPVTPNSASAAGALTAWATPGPTGSAASWLDPGGTIVTPSIRNCGAVTAAIRSVLAAAEPANWGVVGNAPASPFPSGYCDGFIAPSPQSPQLTTRVMRNALDL